MSSGRAFFVTALVLLPLFSSASSAFAQAALNAVVTTETKRGYGRFIITLPDRTRFVKYTISTDDNVLVVRLEEPLSLDLDREITPLSDYVLVARKDPEGSVLRFALAADVRVNTMAAGEHLYIDFLPREWRGENPALPQEIVRKLEKRAEDALELAEQNAVTNEKKGVKAELSVGVGRHPTFSRFVFSWNVPFEASFKRNGSEAVVVFDKLGEFDFASLNANLPSLVRKVEGALGKDSTTVSIKMHKSAKVRSYLDGDEYIVDITNEELTQKANGAQSLPFLIGGLPDLPEGAEDVSQTISKQVGRPLASLPKKPAIEEDTPSSDQEGDPQRSDSDSAAEIASLERDDGQISNQQEKPLDQDQDEAERQAKAAQPNNARNPEKLDKSKKKVQGLSTVEASINDGKDALRLVFPFEKTTPSAVFRRGKSVWMVFKTDDLIDFSSIESLKGEFVRSVELIENGKYKALRIGLPSAQLASAAIDENNWVVSVGNSVIRASQPLSISRKVNNEGGVYLSIPLPQAEGIVALTDPVVGDDVHVVVANPPARGLVRQQNFVMLRMLPSTHAFAFVPVGDRVKTLIEEESVSISSEGQLNLSPIKSLRASASGKLSTDEWYDEPLELDDTSVVDPGKFGDHERILQKALLEALEDQRPRRHIDLAKFYVSNGFNPEALASLTRAVTEQPLLENKRTYVFSKAAAELKMGRYDDALQTLSGESYAKDQDAAVWRTMAAAGVGKWDLVLRNAALGRVKLSSYDAQTQQDFFLSQARGALETGDLNHAKNSLTNVVLRNAKEYQRGLYEVLQGELALADGRLEDAKFFFDRANQIEDIRIKASARLNLIFLSHKTGAADNKTTIDALEKFAAVWRNDDLELKALRKLGEVLAEEEEYRRAFQLVQTAVISNKDSPIAHAIQDDMKRLFLTLFHGGEADGLPPIDALSLYYDFKNLMPIGRVGDEIVRYLARRLIDLDLLPQAAELLEHQVDKRLVGAARARVAADLAAVQLLDGKPHRAITTLNKSISASLPVSLQRQRRLVEAYALSEVGKHDVALELLASLDGEDVDRLRANINWDARRWAEAGELLEKAHSGRWSDIEPLEPHVRLDIMRAAIGFSLAKDDFALNRLNQKFGQKMSESTDAAVFQILTQPLTEQSFDRDVAVDSILNIGTTDSFLRDYRRRYLSHGVAKSDA